MASGDVLISVSSMPFGSAPSSDGADLTFIAGASTPAEVIPVLAFDAGATEHWDFPLELVNYDGGGLTLTAKVGSASVAGGATQARWQAAIRRVDDDAEDLDTTAHTYDYNGASVTPPSAIGELKAAAIAFTSGADMDSLADGERFILRIQRDHDHADDDMTGDALLHSFVISET